ncbi:MAG: hypothetical protein PVF43_09445 [Candidatus Eiseniibacteriota bacterium]|jgi:hypothetical protein
MIYSKELTARSPLRVFERSIHGGLGRGNLGVVFSRAGVGKTAFLVGVALDELLQGRKVLHLSIGDSVDHVRSFYDEVFNELAGSTELTDRTAAHLRVERNRYIHTFRGDSFEIAKIRGNLDFIREHQQFEPVMIVIDGYDGFDTLAADPLTLERELAELREIAREIGAEMWVSARSHREDRELDGRGVPAIIARVEDAVAVLVGLEPMADHVRLRLHKDHENPDVAELQIELDPTSLLLRWS